MFGFWKKNDGFEWHKYVRTTIKLRRQDRRAKVLEARDVAVDGLKLGARAGAAAAVQGVSGLGHTLRQIMQATLSGVLALPSVIARAVSDLLRPIGRQLGPKVRPLLLPLCRPGIPLLLLIIAVLAALSGGSPLRTGRLDSDGVIASAVSMIAFILALSPLITGQARLRLPSAIAARLESIPESVRRGAILTGAGVVALGAGYLAWTSGAGRVAGLAGLPGLSTKTVEGRASAVAGDIVRVNNTVIRLSGIEVPEARQRCTGPGKRTWKCADTAQDALVKAVRGKSLRCEINVADDAGRPLGRCYAGADDVAERVVREGGAFATGSLFARYGSAESEARAQKAGIWRASDIERPADYRAKLWETARKAAPDGCPIKGQIASDRRIYVLPWSPDYERVKVRTTKGERWFCSESEAVGAGWKPAERG